MAVIVLLELRFKPEEVAAGRELMGRTLEVTRAFEGNLRTDVWFDEADEAHWIIYEEWASVGLNVTISALAQSRIRRLPVPLDDKVVTAEQRLADLFAAADQIPEAPDFAKWVDRRFNSALVVSSAT